MQTVGSGIEAIRLGAWLFSAVTLVFVWLFARSWAGPRTAALAAIVFAIVSGSPTIEGFTANAEVFMGLPAAIGAWLLLRASRREWQPWPLIAVGVCAGLATLLKPSGVVMIGVALAYIWLTAGSTRFAVRRGAYVILGVIVSLAPALIHGWWLGWDAYLFAAVTYRLRYQSSATSSALHHLGAIGALLMRCWIELALVALVASWGHWQRGGWVRVWRGLERRLDTAMRAGLVARPVGIAITRPPDDGTLLLRLWLLGGLAGIAMGGDWWYHYLMQIAAPFAIWFGELLRTVAARQRAWRRPAFVALALVVLLLPYRVIAVGDDGKISRLLFNQPGYPDQEAVAAYLREETPPESTIFVGFDQAALYYLADRPAAYRYMYDQELRALPNSEAELIALIESPNRPDYIVVTRQRAPFPDHGRAFWHAVGEHYRLDTTIRGVPIYKAIEGAWGAGIGRWEPGGRE
jgi:4-amino-4-deoxy-L-arabinose transferase-like glycosyltransferase